MVNTIMCDKNQIHANVGRNTWALAKRSFVSLLNDTEKWPRWRAQETQNTRGKVEKQRNDQIVWCHLTIMSAMSYPA